ncbi:hypothetical protein [Streptomyces sp. S.PB5]|uniref:hypothetical protein n=1 Tax=Streptomyces sp. S.PB5 TaxID=3020844 RepID=UPI0025AFBC29|nr:hypothetical protein [Streptomyces sp. S.PB5]MDN3027583.1 hypothetical protein [Streptomyces sp. S.PB5]
MSASRKPPVLHRLPDGSFLSRLGAVEVRILECEITIATSAGRTTGVYRPATTLLPGNDEAELAVDDLARVIESHRIRILRTEYDQIAAAAEQLGALDSLTEVRIDRFIRD